MSNLEATIQNRKSITFRVADVSYYWAPDSWQRWERQIPWYGLLNLWYGLWYGFDLQNHSVLPRSLRVYDLGPMYTTPPINRPLSRRRPLSRGPLPIFPNGSPRSICQRSPEICTKLHRLKFRTAIWCKSRRQKLRQSALNCTKLH